MAKPFSVRKQTGFTSIAVICFAALYLPIFVLVIFSFNTGEQLSKWEGFSFIWYVKAFANQDVLKAALLSFEIAIVAATVSTIVATMAAIATTRTDPYPGLQFKYAFINQPLMVPEIVTAIALLILTARLKAWTGYSGIGYLMAAHTAFCVPFAYMPIRARLENMDLTLERAAADLYATPWNAFRYVTLPILWPGIVAGFMLAFVISLDDVVITNLVKSAGQNTLPTFMLGQMRRAITPEIYAVSSVFFAISVAIVTVFFFINKKRPN